MNLLIIGGLLAVGILAIIGAALLGISEQRAEARAKQASLANENTTLMRGRTISNETTGSLRRQMPVVPAGETHLAPLNGQFAELAGEIRSLHQQAIDLEERLSTLTDMIDHLGRAQNNHISIAEEAATSEDGN